MFLLFPKNIQYANKERNEESDRFEEDAINKVRAAIKHWKR